jgi:type VI secretion system secreted protein VgrG
MKLRIPASLLIALLATTASAQVPGILSYQGRVTVNGSAFDGTGQFKFALVDAGQLIPRPPMPPIWVHATHWSHDGSSSAGSTPTSSVPVLVSKGLYSVMLGDTGVEGMTQPIPAWVFTNAQVYLRVWFDDGTNGEQRLIPDQRIGANAYALKAAGVDARAVTAEMLANGAVTTAALGDGAVTGDKIQSGSVKLSQLDDGGAASFERFQEAAEAVAPGSGLAFSDLFPVGARDTPPSLALRLNNSPFGTVVGFTGTEEISGPCSYVVQTVYTGEPVDPRAHLGAPAVLVFARNGRTTSFGGLVTASTLSGSDGKKFLFTLRIEPALASLALNTDYRVHQGKTVAEAASAVYQSIVGSAPVNTIGGTYSQHDCLIQYRETALNFFNRLLEYEGIFYFFDQRAVAPELVLVDNNGACLETPNSPFAYFGDTATIPLSAPEYIRTFQRAVHQSTLKAFISGYNLEAPSVSLQSATQSPTGGTGEAYEFGGLANRTKAYNDLLAKVRIERQETERSAIAGSSVIPDVRAGYKFVLNDQSGAGLEGAYLVTSVRHAAFVRVTNGVSTFFYGNRFEVIPDSVQFRPALRTPKPQAQSCTAVVTGPAGQEIYTDKYGRIKVQFHWDRYGVKDDKSSAWVRVASPWAGNAYGVSFLPRVGHEVLVEFIQGNPDQPVVVGSLYNAEKMPPYALPANQTVSTIKTRSSPGGTANNYNEIRFEDKKGSEALQISAEKDLNVSAKNDATLAVGHNLSGNVANDATLIFGHDLRLDVGNSFSVSGAAFSSSAAQNLFSGQSTFSGPVTVSDNLQAYGNFMMNQKELYLKDDDKHGLGYYGGTKLFAGLRPDGPVLYGYSGGALGTVTFTESRVALNWNNSGKVAVGGTNSPASALDVYGDVTVRSNLVVQGTISTALPYQASGSLVRVRSIIVSMVSLPSVAANAWTKIGDLGTFTKNGADSLMEITYNGRLAVGSWGAGATGANFELRVDNQPVALGVARATVMPGDNPNYGVSASMTGLFTGLGSGNHTVSVWVYSYNGTASTLAVNPGNFTAPHVVIKEFK